MSRVLTGLFIFFVAFIVLILLGSSFVISSDLPRHDLVDKYRNEASFFYPLPSGNLAHIRDEGRRDGAPLVLIHGAQSSLHTWQGWVDALGDRYRLISIDLPGHGLTGQTSEDDYSLDAMTRFTKDIIDLFGLKKVVLAGNSMGGSVALKFALEYPGHVRALVLTSPGGMMRDANADAVGAFSLTSSNAARSMMRYITPRFLIANTLRGLVADSDMIVTDAMVTRYWELLRMTGSREAAIKRLANRDTAMSLEPLLPAVRAPTLILWGALDPLIPMTQGVRMASAIRDSRIKIYPNAAHLAQVEIPEETAADTRAFLENLGVK